MRFSERQTAPQQGLWPEGPGKELLRNDFRLISAFGMRTADSVFVARRYFLLFFKVYSQETKFPFAFSLTEIEALSWYVYKERILVLYSFIRTYG